MYNLKEYSHIYSEAKGSSWYHFEDEVTAFNNDIENTDDFKRYKYNAKLLGKTVAQLSLNQTNENWKMQHLLCHQNI